MKSRRLSIIRKKTYGGDGTTVHICAVVTLVFYCLIFPAISCSEVAEYIYDDVGRLIAVLDAKGNESIYRYDEVGNLINIISQSDTSPLFISDFYPREGFSGDEITIYGSGFSAEPLENVVSFKGTAATILSATVNRMVVMVPQGAITGKITLLNQNGLATSRDEFTVLFSFGDLEILPSHTFIWGEKTRQFMAFTGGVETKNVIWKVQDMEGGNPKYGYITAGGSYTAPHTLSGIDEISVSAEDMNDPGKKATARLYIRPTITSSPVSVSFINMPSSGGTIACAPVSVRIGQLSDGSTTLAIPISVMFLNIGTIVSGPVSVEVFAP
jgi:YD repeat-containing protein